MTQSDPMLGLAGWYEQQCNGSWEHEYGISIKTLDNPGWEIEIDLACTTLETCTFELVQHDASEDDWYTCRVEQAKFRGYAAPRKLNEVLRIFLGWSDECARTREGPG
jgi:hypothetical protein